jgi:hypothetical protein
VEKYSYVTIEIFRLRSALNYGKKRLRRFLTTCSHKNLVYYTLLTTNKVSKKPYFRNERLALHVSNYVQKCKKKLRIAYGHFNFLCK